MNQPNNFDSLSFEDEDIIFLKSIKTLEQIKLVLGGQALYSTLRKRKILRKFLESYIKQHHGVVLDDIEEKICNLGN